MTSPQENIQKRIDIVRENQATFLKIHADLKTQVEQIEMKINACTGAIEQLTFCLNQDFTQPEPLEGEQP